MNPFKLESFHAAKGHPRIIQDFQVSVGSVIGPLIALGGYTKRRTFMSSMSEKQRVAVGILLLGLGVLAGVMLSGCGAKSQPGKKAATQEAGGGVQSADSLRFDPAVIFEDPKMQGVPSSEASASKKMKGVKGHDEIGFDNVLELTQEAYLVWGANIGDSEIVNAFYTYENDSNRRLETKSVVHDVEMGRYYIPLMASTGQRPEDIDGLTLNIFRIELILKNGIILNKTVTIHMSGPVGKVTQSKTDMSSAMGSTQEVIQKLTHQGLVIGEESFKNESGQNLSGWIQIRSSSMVISTGVHHDYFGGNPIQNRSEFFKSRVKLDALKWAHLKVLNADGNSVGETDVTIKNGLVQFPLLPWGTTQVQWMAQSSLAEVAPCSLPPPITDLIRVGIPMGFKTGTLFCPDSASIECLRDPSDRPGPQPAPPHVNPPESHINQYVPTGARLDFALERTVGINRGAKLPEFNEFTSVQNPQGVDLGWSDFYCQGII